MSDKYEDDPAISAIYRKAGDLAPPGSLDDVILTAAKRAAWRRKQRWILPLSTAAVVVLSVTLLMNMSEEWDFRRNKAGSSPTPQTSSSAPEPALVKKRESSIPPVPPELKVEEDSQSVAPATISAEKPSSSRPSSSMAKAAPTYSNRIGTDSSTHVQGASASSDEVKVQAARSKVEDKGVLTLTDSVSSKENTQDKKAAIKEEEATKLYPEQEATDLKATGTPPLARKELIEMKVMEPKPWITKIRKLVSSGEKESALKELEAFKKRYPKYKLPDDLKSL